MTGEAVVDGRLAPAMIPTEKKLGPIMWTPSLKIRVF